MNQIWNPEYETMGRDQLRELQWKRLQMTLRWAYANVPFYRTRWEAAGFAPPDLRSLEGVSRIPFTHKDDFRAAYPYGMFAVPLERVVRVHTSSGSAASPTVMGFTRGDLNTWAELCARVATAGGARSHDVAQITLGYGLPTGAFGLHAGLERLGATVIPASTGASKRQLLIMRDYSVSVLVASPSYALHLVDTADELGFDLSQLTLRTALLGAERWGEGMRGRVEGRLGLSAVDNYGVSEVLGPGLSFECPMKQGLHVNEDHFLVEVVDPGSGEVLPVGEEGELVFTSLTKEAVPVVRYRTGDLARLSAKACACGRTLVRHSRVTGRTDGMLKVRGVNIFPAQIERVLEEVEGTHPQFQIILDEKASLDQMEVRVAVKAEFFPDSMRSLLDFRRRLEGRLQEELGVRATVMLVEPASLPEDIAAQGQVVDRRDKS